MKILDERIVSSNSNIFKQEISAAIGDGQHHFILDLSNVSFVDSSGLGAIVGGVKLLKDDSVFFICGPQGPIRDTLQMLQLERILTIADSMSQVEAEIG
jgi:anti-sigma B factor antagonist